MGNPKKHNVEFVSINETFDTSTPMGRAMPDIIQCLLQEGYTFVPISQMILSGEYTIHHTGRQRPA